MPLLRLSPLVAIVVLVLAGAAGGAQSETTPLSIVTASLPNGNVGTTYTVFPDSSKVGGTPHKWRVIAGTLPAGLTMAEFYGVYATVINGRPTTEGTSAFTLEVRDTSGTKATRSFTITIDPPLPLVLSNQNSDLGPATVGTFYSRNISTKGGVPPYTWSRTAGQFPPGLSLTKNVLSGTPTTAGAFAFTIQVKDSKGVTASRDFTISVS